MRAAGLQSKLDTLENEKLELLKTLESPTSATVSLHPALTDLYKQKINQFADVSKDLKVRIQATLLIRELIERVDIDYNENSRDIEIKGEISALVSLAQNVKSPPKGRLNHDALASSTKVVAGVHNSRCRI